MVKYMPSDIIHDCLDTLIALLRQAGVHPEPAVRGEAERRLREQWGGDTAYIGKTSADSLQQRSARDKAILRDWAHGLHIPALARRYNLAERTIRHIVRLQAEIPATVALSHCRDLAQDAGNESNGDIASQPHRRRQPKAAVRAA
jgi:Mor family transcriptional regulator